MEAQQTQTGDLYTFLGWLDKNRGALIKGAVVVVLAGIIVSFVLWRQGVKEVEAGEKLSSLLASAGQAGGISPESLLKVSADFSGTRAAARAQLAAAGQFFTEGKYAEAQTQFQKFLSDDSSNPLAPQASLGLAASLEAQKKSAEATAAYKGIVDRKQDAAATGQARFALARLYQADGKLVQARDLYMELANDPYSMGGAEAATKLNELLQKHPELRPSTPGGPATNPAVVKPAN